MNASVPISFFAEIQAKLEPQRHACEVRYVARFDTDARRAVYLEGVLEKRGRVCYDKLRRDVWEYLKEKGRSVEPRQEALAL